MTGSGGRVVITGKGVVSSLGNTPEELYANLAAGRSGVREMPDWGGTPLKLAAPAILPEGMEKTIPRTFRRAMGRVGMYSALAARAAAEDAGLSAEFLKSGDCGCVIGSTMGGSGSIAETFRLLLSGRGEEIPATQFFKCVSHTAAFNAANLLGICGVVESPSAACASGLQALGLARDLIARGAQKAVICGGAEELSPEVNASFDQIYASVNSEPGEGGARRESRPFDAARCGLVCGDGAGILVLEELDHALERGAHIYGEVIGFATCGCGSTLSQSDASAIRRCLELVCRDAGITPGQIDYVSAHATATVQGDREEAAALRSFFGDRVPVSSLKGHLGHTLGASGSLELIAVLLMMERSELLPTLHLEHIAEDCSGVNLIREKQTQEIGVFLKNCFAFGGINATLLCSKWKRENCGKQVREDRL